MQDVEYVKQVLAEPYKTELADEIAYPSLEDVIDQTGFNYLSGSVDGEVANGSKNREGQDYLWFKHGKKSILSHRFVVAVTLGKWPPRDFDVDHINHDPSDNRPSNLRVVTRRDNAGNRRAALLSDLVDLESVQESLDKRKQALEARFESNKVAEERSLSSSHASNGGIPTVTYTGETKPAEHSDGVWRKTNLGSWHLHFE